jgi:HEAT repeat protein
MLMIDKCNFQRISYCVLIFSIILSSICTAGAIAEQYQDSCIQAIRSSTFETKLNAATEIIAVPTRERIIALLDETSKSVNLDMRGRLLGNVEQIDANNYPDELIEVLGQLRNNDLRDSVRRSLLKSSSPRVVANLIALVNSNMADQRLVRDIGRTLSQIRNPQAINNLLNGFNSPHVSIFAGCAMAVAEIGSDEENHYY